MKAFGSGLIHIGCNRNSQGITRGSSHNLIGRVDIVPVSVRRTTRRLCSIRLQGSCGIDIGLVERLFSACFISCKDYRTIDKGTCDSNMFFFTCHIDSLLRGLGQNILCLIPRSVLLYFWWMCRNRDPSLTAHHSSSPICNAAQAQASHPICPHHVVPFLRVCLGDKLTNQLLGAPSLGRYFRHLNLIVALNYSPNSKGGSRVRLRTVQRQRTTRTTAFAPFSRSIFNDPASQCLHHNKELISRA